MTIATDMIPTSSSIAIIANAIGINSAVTEVDAILIGNTVDIGASATKLKINGNPHTAYQHDPFHQFKSYRKRPIAVALYQI